MSDLFEKFKTKYACRTKLDWHISGLTADQLYCINAYDDTWLDSMADPAYKQVKRFQSVLVFDDERDVMSEFCLLKTPIEDDSVVWTLPFEGFGQFPNYVMHRIATEFPSKFRIEFGKPETVLHSKQSFVGASNSRFSLGRYYHKFATTVSGRTIIDRGEHNRLAAMLWEQNMDRFEHLYPVYPYAKSPYECPHQEFFNRRLECAQRSFLPNTLKLLCLEDEKTGELIALVYYSIDENEVIHWERTLRTFDLKYKSLKVGICSTLFLMAMYPEYTFNLGLEMDYKINHYAAPNEFWDYDRKLSPNLVML